MLRDLYDHRFDVLRTRFGILMTNTGFLAVQNPALDINQSQCDSY